MDGHKLKSGMRCGSDGASWLRHEDGSGERGPAGVRQVIVHAGSISRSGDATGGSEGGGGGGEEKDGGEEKSGEGIGDSVGGVRGETRGAPNIIIPCRPPPPPPPSPTMLLLLLFTGRQGLAAAAAAGGPLGCDAVVVGCEVGP
jgi:hypothetical protein